MNTPEHTPRPFGFWITAIDRLMSERFSAAFESEGITRRDWRMLNTVVEGGDPRTSKIHRLVERGWIARTRDSWQLTEAGREAKDRLGAIVEGIRAQVADVVTAEDYAVMTASLENIARAFGWEEGKPLPRRGSGRSRSGRRTPWMPGDPRGAWMHARSEPCHSHSHSHQDEHHRRAHGKPGHENGHDRHAHNPWRGAPRHAHDGADRDECHGRRGHRPHSQHIHIHTHG